MSASFLESDYFEEGSGNLALGFSQSLLLKITALISNFTSFQTHWKL